LVSLGAATDIDPLPGAGVTRLFANRFQTTCNAWLINLTGATNAFRVEVLARKDDGATGNSKILSGNQTSRIIVHEVP
jgi:hypothetical protein